jgi:hypothetical protein
MVVTRVRYSEAFKIQAVKPFESDTPEYPPNTRIPLEMNIPSPGFPPGRLIPEAAVLDRTSPAGDQINRDRARMIEAGSRWLCGGFS